MMEINQLEGMDNNAFEVFIINLTRDASRIRESMFHIYYIMHESVDVSIDLEVKDEGLCLTKCDKTYNHMKLWDEILIKKYRKKNCYPL